MTNIQMLHACLQNGGNTGKLIAATDWEQHPLGPMDTWPGQLCASLALILPAGFPMLLYWGPQHYIFYNDAYRYGLGKNGQDCLGCPALETWPEVKDTLQPILDGILNGGPAVGGEDQLVPLSREMHMQDIYCTFSFSPVYGLAGFPEGVLTVCYDTSDKVRTLHKEAEANDQLVFAIDAADLGTWDLNPATNKFWSNERLKEWFGLEQETGAIVLDDAIAAIDAADRARVVQSIQQALDYASGGDYNIEFEVVHPATQYRRTVRAIGKATFNEHRAAVRFNGILQDVTSERTARKTEQYLRTLVENSVDLMAILGLNGKNLYINDAGKELLGIDADADVTQIPIAQFHTPEQLEFVTSTLIPAVMNTGRWSGQFAIRNCRTGEIIPLYNNCHRIDDIRTGQPIAIGAVMRDMRTEIAAIRELAEKEERLNVALNATDLGMWEWQYHNDDFSYSPAYLRILGFKETDAPSHELLISRIHPDDMAFRNRAIRQALRDGMLQMELRIIHKDNSVHWISVKGKVLYNAGHQPERLLGTVMDITEQKNAAMRLEQKVEERTHDLREANRELEKINQELASFAYVSSHDLQEPLRKIRTFISRIVDTEQDRLSDKGKAYFERISYAAERMKVLITDLLSFSRTSTAEKNYEPTDLNVLMKHVIDDLQDDVQRQLATIRTGKLPVLPVIPFQIYQLFNNLISNAIKFARRDVLPQIDIRAELLPAASIPYELPGNTVRYYHISVTDNGIGFLPEYRERIFEVFQRLHGKTEYEGTGIGLAICRKIMSNHMGIIMAEGHPGQGAVFHLYFPETWQ